MRGTAVYARTLQRAVELLGSKGDLRDFLCVSDLTAREEDVLDHIARRTAFWLDGGTR